MKYLNSDGTNKDSFSIGLGSNKVELISVNGALHYRNFKDLIRPVGSGSGSGTTGGTIPRPYVLGDAYDAGELIAHNGSLWRTNAVISNSTNTSFLAISPYVDRISDYSGLKRERIDTNVTLLKEDHVFVLLYDDGVPTAGNVITLPNPNSPVGNLSVGYQYLIQNDSPNFASVIRNSSASTLGTIDPGRLGIITLFDATNNFWSLMQIGGGSASTASGEKLTITINGLIPSATVGSIVENDATGSWVLASDTNNHSNVEKTLGIVESIAGTTSTTILLWGYSNVSFAGGALGETYYLVGSNRTTTLDENSAAYYLYKSFGAGTILFEPRRIRRQRSIGDTITQNAHNFSVGHGVYYDGSVLPFGWKKSTETNPPIGVVSKVVDVNNFSIVTSGRLSLTVPEWQNVLPDISDITGTAKFSLIPGKTYYPLTLPGAGINLARSYGAFTDIAPGPSDPQKRAVFTAVSSTDVIVSLGIETAPTAAGSLGPNIFIDTANFKVGVTPRLGMPIYYDSTVSLWDSAIANNNETIGRAIITALPVLPSTLVTATLYGQVSFPTTADLQHVLESSADGNGGSITGGFQPGKTYYLSDLLKGKITLSSPLYSEPLLYAISTTSAIIQMGFQALEAGETANRFLDVFTFASNPLALSRIPIGKEYIDVFVNGTYINDNDFTYSGASNSISITSGVSVGDRVEVKYFKGINLAARYNSYTISGTEIVKDPALSPFPIGHPTPSYTAIDPLIQIQLPFKPAHKGLINFVLGGVQQADSDYILIDEYILWVWAGLTVGDPWDYSVTIKEEVSENRGIYGYIGRKVKIISDTLSATIRNDIYINDLRSGIYEVQVQEDPRMYFKIFAFLDSSNNVSIESEIPAFATSISSTLGTPSSINFGVLANDIVIENLSGTSYTFIVYRKV